MKNRYFFFLFLITGCFSQKTVVIDEQPHNKVSNSVVTNNLKNVDQTKKIIASSSKRMTNDVRNFYVSNEGNDNYDGTMEHPFKTLGQAIKVVQQSNNKFFSIFLRGGNYQINNTINILDLNVKTLSISNYENEIVDIVGGVKLDNGKFHKVADEAVRKRLYKNVVNYIYVTNLKDQGVSDFGVMNAYSWSASLPTALELFYNQTPLTIARWPNNGLLSIDSVVENGNLSASTPPIIKYLYDRPNRWADTKDIWAWGHFNYDWCYDNISVSQIDKTKRIVKFGNKINFGIFSSGDKSYTEAAMKMRGYYFYNILEELDSVGEWYLNRDNGNLYILPISPIEKATIQVSLLETPLIMISNSENIIIKNLDFSCARGTGLEIKNCKNTNIENCEFRNIGKFAISVESNSNNIKINNCIIKHIGGGGIKLDGGNRNTLSPGNNVISNCDFSDFSRVYQSYNPAVYISGVGNSVINCNIHDAPDQAILYSGNNHTISHNHFSNLCYDYGDMGAIYTGRDPSSTGTIIYDNYFEHIKSKLGSISAVYMDDGSGGIIVNNNFFSDACSGGYGAVHINGGGNNKFENNVFYNCAKTFSNSYWSDENWKKTFFRDSMNLKKLIKDVDIRSSIYLERYPYLKDFFDSAHINLRINYINNSICYDVQSVTTSSNSLVVTNTFTTTTNPGFRDIEHSDFTLTTIPEEVKKWKNWTPIEFKKIGIQPKLTQ